MNAICRIALATLVLTWGFAFAQAYPSRPVRLIIDFPAGGASDALARLVGQKLTETWGQPVVYDNRPGANGVIAYGLAAKAPPDGYTFVLLSTPFPLNAVLERKLSYDTVRDITPISFIASYSNLLVVNPSVPARSVQEFVSYAKSKAGTVTYASSGNGSVQHLAMELFRQQAGFGAVHVPYAGSAPAVIDLLGGHVEAAVTILTTVLPYLRSGRIRVLGVLSANRVTQLPDVPTLVELGIPVVATGWGGLGAPAGISRRIVESLNKEVGRIINLPDVKEKIVALGGEPRHGTPEEFARFIREEVERWGPIFRQSGAKVQ
jgi:tripartite-type tricarboxylate transporter receptor subunit TctC